MSAKPWANEKTPETDAEEATCTGHIEDAYSFARKLERERDEARENLAKVVSAILKRNGRCVVDMTVMDRIEELHSSEREREANTSGGIGSP